MKSGNPISKFSLAFEKIANVGRILYDKGLIVASEGNISLRLESGNIMITPSGKNKGFLIFEDMVTIDLAGIQVSGKQKPSSEFRMHLFAYNNRDDISACIHAHPPFTTALSVAGISDNNAILPETVISAGRIPVTQYATPGTDELTLSISPFIEECDAIIIKNHGLVCFGKDLDSALNLLEIVEHNSKILYLSRQLGNIDYLSESEVEKLLTIKESKKPAAGSGISGKTKGGKNNND
ncbi:MAG: class II aldolase/adducin family protein [candidate division Zixibacteria bacterium]